MLQSSKKTHLNHRISRRAFHSSLAKGLAAASFMNLENMMFSKSVFDEGGITTAQAKAVGLTMLTTDDLTPSANLPFGGVYRHAWCCLC